MSQYYAVFRMNLWIRDFQPIEIFHDPDEGRKFAEELNSKESEEGVRWVLYRRTPTDWEIG